MENIGNNWNFEDYPTETWKNRNAADEKIAYGAGIINWDMMVGYGETPEKALIALYDKFKLFKENNAILPQPGTKVPLKFASASKMEKYEKIAVDFFEKYLALIIMNVFSLMKVVYPIWNHMKMKETVIRIHLRKKLSNERNQFIMLTLLMFMIFQFGWF